MTVTCTDPRINVATLQHAADIFGGRTYSYTPMGAGKEIIDCQGIFGPDHQLSKHYKNGVRTVIIYAHNDCLPYRSICRDMNPGQEEKHQKGELRRARALLKKAFPDVWVRCFYAEIEVSEKGRIKKIIEVK